MRPVGVLNFGNSSSLWSKAKRSSSQSYPQALFASPLVGSTACTCVLDSLYSPWNGTLPHWCCPSLQAGRLWEICQKPRPKEAVHSHIRRQLFASPTVGSTACTSTCVLESLYLLWDDTLPHWCCPCLQQVYCERPAASKMFSQRLVLNVQNRSKMQHSSRASEIRVLPHKLRKSRSLPFCPHTTSRVKRPSVGLHVVARRESERTFFSSAKGVAQFLREPPLAADDLSAVAQHLPDVERRRRCWSILEAGFLSLIPSPSRYAKRPEKRWLCTRRSSFCREKRVAVEALLVTAPFLTEAVLTVLHRNDPHWPRQDCAFSQLRDVTHTNFRSLEGLILRSHPIGSKSKSNRVSQPPRRLWYSITLGLWPRCLRTSKFLSSVDLPRNCMHHECFLIPRLFSKTIVHLLPTGTCNMLQHHEHKHENLELWRH